MYTYDLPNVVSNVSMPTGMLERFECQCNECIELHARHIFWVARRKCLEKKPFSLLFYFSLCRCHKVFTKCLCLCVVCWNWMIPRRFVSYQACFWRKINAHPFQAFITRLFIDENWTTSKNEIRVNNDTIHTATCYARPYIAPHLNMRLFVCWSNDVNVFSCLFRPIARLAFAPKYTTHIRNSIGFWCTNRHPFGNSILMGHRLHTLQFVKWIYRIERASV